jgi:prefoldin subunit 5
MPKKTRATRQRTPSTDTAAERFERESADLREQMKIMMDKLTLLEKENECLKKEIAQKANNKETRESAQKANN